MGKLFDRESHPEKHRRAVDRDWSSAGQRFLVNGPVSPAPPWWTVQGDRETWTDNRTPIWFRKYCDARWVSGCRPAARVPPAPVAASSTFVRSLDSRKGGCDEFSLAHVPQTLWTESRTARRNRDKNNFSTTFVLLPPDARASSLSQRTQTSMLRLRCTLFDLSSRFCSSILIG